MKSMLKTGCLAGLAGGIALALFMVTIGSGPIDDAIALEDTLAAEASTGDDHDAGVQTTGHAARTHEDLFTRGVQEVGGIIGLLVFGVAVGAIFAVVLAAASSALAASSAFESSVRLGLIGFWTVVVVPFLKMPANPPAVGDPDTINERTLLYFAVLLTSISLIVAMFKIWRDVKLSLVPRAWLAAGTYAIGLIVIFAVLPDNPDDIPAPAQLVWRFRLASLGGLASLWAVMALTMGTLLERKAAEVRNGSRSSTTAQTH